MNERLSDVLSESWRMLANAARDRGDPARFVGLASVRINRPSLRTLALRSADQVSGQVGLNTDLRSHKVGEIAANPNVALLFWNAEARVQLRLVGAARIARGSEAEWLDVPEPSREAYGHIPAPGTDIIAPDAWRVRPDPANFGLITMTVSEIDYVSLAETGHRRAVFRRDQRWIGTWCAP